MIIQLKPVSILLDEIYEQIKSWSRSEAFHEAVSVMNGVRYLKCFMLSEHISPDEFRTIAHLMTKIQHKRTYERESLVGYSEVHNPGGKPTGDTEAQYEYRRYYGMRTDYVVLPHRVLEVERILNIKYSNTVLGRHEAEYANSLDGRVATGNLTRQEADDMMQTLRSELTWRGKCWDRLFKNEPSERAAINQQEQNERTALIQQKQRARSDRDRREAARAEFLASLKYQAYLRNLSEAKKAAQLEKWEALVERQKAFVEALQQPDGKLLVSHSDHGIGSITKLFFDHPTLSGGEPFNANLATEWPRVTFQIIDHPKYSVTYLDGRREEFTYKQSAEHTTVCRPRYIVRVMINFDGHYVSVQWGQVPQPPSLSLISIT